MASRPLLSPYSVVTNGNMATSLTSMVTNIEQLSYISYTVGWSGAPVGAITVQVCNDYFTNPDGSVRNAGTWVTIPLTSPVTPAGTTDTAFIDIPGTAAAWMRLVYTRTSGTGTLNAVVAGKVS